MLLKLVLCVSLLGGATLGNQTAAAATSTEAHHDKEFWRMIAKNNFKPPAGSATSELAFELSSNVLVNVETQDFELVGDAKGTQFNLLRSITAQQLLNAAGRDFVLQRKVQFSNYVINAPDFSATVAAERSSDDPMFRDTDHGLRSLRKKGDDRVLVDSSVKRIRSLIGGAMYEGTFNFPIPFLGISIADFDFRHTGAQLSTFFAGPILLTDLSKQYRPKFRLALDLSLNGLPGENRVYSGNAELVQGQVWTWEQTTGLRASWQATNHLSVTAASYFAYDNFLRTSQADEQYQLPRNGLTVRTTFIVSGGCASEFCTNLCAIRARYASTAGSCRTRSSWSSWRANS